MVPAPLNILSPELVQTLAKADVWAAGAFALEQGQIITAMLLPRCWWT